VNSDGILEVLQGGSHLHSDSVALELAKYLSDLTCMRPTIVEADNPSIICLVDDEFGVAGLSQVVLIEVPLQRLERRVVNTYILLAKLGNGVLF